MVNQRQVGRQEVSIPEQKMLAVVDAAELAVTRFPQYSHNDWPVPGSHGNKGRRCRGELMVFVKRNGTYNEVITTCLVQGVDKGIDGLDRTVGQWTPLVTYI
ncbi:hypothetical protein J6590_019699 [Homalodisca vitripennis]|nr:hypothetical protein J6590_019699 [Homalodisca vitripennis]